MLSITTTHANMNRLLLSILSAILLTGTSYGQSVSASTLESDLLGLANNQLFQPKEISIHDWRMALLYEAFLRISSATGETSLMAELIRFGTIGGWSANPSQGNVAGFAVLGPWLGIASQDLSQEYRYQFARSQLATLEVEKASIPGGMFFVLPALARMTTIEEGGKHLESLVEVVERSDGEIMTALDYFGLAIAVETLENPPTALERVFLRYSRDLLGEQRADGFWEADRLNAGQLPFTDLGASALVAFGMTVGIKSGLLDMESYLPALFKVQERVYALEPRVGSVEPWEIGALLAAGAEILRLQRMKTGIADKQVALAEAEEMSRSEKRPRAQVQYVPTRKDDIAWENDQMAFRIYGPALRDSAENSGVDVWIKRVSYPIVEKWYRLDLAGVSSYHEDSGEGYDGYKVGPRRGCGGLGLWKAGELETSNVYRSFEILWSNRYQARFRVVYDYPDGTKEEKLVVTRLGSDLCEVTAQFSKDGEVLSGLPIAVGLSAQTQGFSIRSLVSDGRMTLTDSVGSDVLETIVDWDPYGQEAAKTLTIGEGSKTEALVILRTDTQGYLRYRFGFRLLE